MRTIAVVPMKLNNERLPNKNTKSFDNGKPLCYYILETLLKVNGIDDIYVYCSNPRIQDFIPKGIKFLRRSESLDTSSTLMNEVLKCFSEEVNADIYLMTHATSPFVLSTSIENALSKVRSGEYDSALAVQKVQEFLWKDGKPFNYDLSNIPRTQDLPKLFAETSGFYIYKKDIIQKFNRRIGFRPYLQEVTKIEATDIDEMDDFLIANAIFNNIIRSVDYDE
ncbi:MAG: acylneuraminate cytidylyltransferase family protein [Clostridiaceae bacterium]|nr:acylneuraminate cytidylyltransferase family protein [Clostridiaceae bacterium]